MMLWKTAALVATSLAAAPLHTDGNFFKDSRGRVVILRGVNVSADAKVPPFTPVQTAAQLDPLPTWGFNVMRLLFTWEAYQPERGVHDAAYMQYIKNIIRWGHARGLYTIIDFHQDALSRFLARGCGEGFPAWAIPEDVPRQNPDNGQNCAKWFLIQWLDNDVHKTWQALYHDDAGLRQAYINMAQKVAHELAHEPGLIGYDLLNEPAGDENGELSPLYEDMAVAVRSVHPDAVLFLEPNAKAVVGLPSRLATPGFDQAVYAPHFYDAITRFINHYPGYPLTHAFNTMQAKALAWNTPLFLGEFGVPPTVSNALHYMRAQYDRLDEIFASSAQWAYTPGWSPETKDGWNMEDFSITDAQGNLRNNFRPRPYAQAVAGTPTHLVVIEADNPKERTVDFTWEHEPTLGDTELFVPHDGFFARSPQIITEGDDLRCTLGGYRLTCTSRQAGAMRVRLASQSALEPVTRRRGSQS